MRADILVRESIAKCDVLKRSGLWLPEPSIRPRAWLQNFDSEDKDVAALLLDKFTFYNARLTDALLKASFHSIGDGMPKGPSAPDSDSLIRSLEQAVFTPVRGESPNPTDSGYLLCRKARQLLGIPQARIVDTSAALVYAQNGTPVVFLDDFVGSGDQFARTWLHDENGISFAQAQALSGFVAIYITLVCTKSGLLNIHSDAPHVAVCSAHVLDSRSTLEGLLSGSQRRHEIDAVLSKYAVRLRPSESYMTQDPSYLRYGYKGRGLLLAFEHSVPDATLPIFWAHGPRWEPLIERK